MNNTKKIAFCGIAVAVSLVLMFLTAIIPMGTYALPAIAGVLAILIVIECGTKYALSVFLAVDILSLLLVPSKISVLAYIAFMGYYPIAKKYIEKIKKVSLQYVVKIFIVNVAMIVSFFVATYVLLIPNDLLNEWGTAVYVVVLVLANIIFIIYDIALTGLISMYFTKYRSKFRFLMK